MAVISYVFHFTSRIGIPDVPYSESIRVPFQES